MTERWSEGRTRGGGESCSNAGTGMREVEAEEEAEAKGEGRRVATGVGAGPGLARVAKGGVAGPGLLGPMSLGPIGRRRTAKGRYAIGEVVIFASAKASSSSGASANASYIVEGRGCVCGTRAKVGSGDAVPNRGWGGGGRDEWRRCERLGGGQIGRAHV